MTWSKRGERTMPIWKFQISKSALLFQNLFPISKSALLFQKNLFTPRDP
jgi:hypothetical protein